MCGEAGPLGPASSGAPWGLLGRVPPDHTGSLAAQPLSRKGPVAPTSHGRWEAP